MENWINALDWCAASGVIDYDAPAFLLDKNPRYLGHPSMEEMPMHNDLLLPEGTKLKSLSSDTFGHGEEGLNHNPTWKKVLFGALAAAGIIAGGLALKKVKLPKIKLPKLSMPKFKLPNFKKFFTNIWNYIKKPFVYISSKIKNLHK